MRPFPPNNDGFHHEAFFFVHSWLHDVELDHTTSHSTENASPGTAQCEYESPVRDRNRSKLKKIEVETWQYKNQLTSYIFA